MSLPHLLSPSTPFPKKEGCGSSPRRQSELGIAAGAGPGRPSLAGLGCQMGSLCNSPHGCCLQPVPTSRIPPGPAGLDHDPPIAPCTATVLRGTPIPDRSPQASEGPQSCFWGSGATRHRHCRCPAGGRDKEPSWVLAALLGKPAITTPSSPVSPAGLEGSPQPGREEKEPNTPRAPQPAVGTARRDRLTALPARGWLERLGDRGSGPCPAPGAAITPARGAASGACRGRRCTSPAAKRRARPRRGRRWGG